MKTHAMIGEVDSAESYRIGPVRLYVINHKYAGPSGPVVGQLIVSHVNIPTHEQFLEAPEDERIYMHFDSPEAFQKTVVFNERTNTVHPVLRKHNFPAEWNNFVLQARQELTIHKSRTKTKSAGFLVSN